MLSGSPTPVQIPPAGSVPIKWKGQHVYAASGQWIAVINAPAGPESREIRKLNKQLTSTGLRR